MYPLLIDCGNSRVKWTLWDKSAPMASEIYAASYPLEAFFKAVIQKPIHAVWVANVAGPLVAKQLKDFFEAKGLSPVFVKSQKSGFGIEQSYLHPEQFGVDRWLALVALAQQSLEKVLVVDAGTCVTVDLLVKQQHVGGWIVPGSVLMRESICTRTGFELEHLAETSRAMLEGISMMQTAFIEFVYRKAEEKVGEGLSLVLTGGGADSLAATLTVPFSVAPNLVLEGLKLFVK